MPRRPRPATRAAPRSKRPHPDDDDREELTEDFREDRPRFAQWVPEDELDVSACGCCSFPTHLSQPSGSGSSSQSESESESKSELNSDSDSDSDAPVAESSKPAKPEWATAKRKKDIEKRSNKHAWVSPYCQDSPYHPNCPCTQSNGDNVQTPRLATPYSR
jgi:hypothetical protein